MAVAENIVFLVAFNHITTKARVRDMREAGFGLRSILHVDTPTDWRQSGFQASAIWLKRGWTGPCDMQELTPDLPALIDIVAPTEPAQLLKPLAD